MSEAPTAARRRPLWILPLIALALLVLITRGCQPADDSPPDLTLLYTGNVHGYIEPRGCSAGQIGGLTLGNGA